MYIITYRRKPFNDTTTVAIVTLTHWPSIIEPILIGAQLRHRVRLQSFLFAHYGEWKFLNCYITFDSFIKFIAINGRPILSFEFLTSYWDIQNHFNVTLLCPPIHFSGALFLFRLISSIIVMDKIINCLLFFLNIIYNWLRWSGHWAFSPIISHRKLPKCRTLKLLNLFHKVLKMFIKMLNSVREVFPSKCYSSLKSIL